MLFEWDDAKNASNLSKHGISFDEAIAIFEGPTLTKRSDGDFGEARSISFGRLGISIVVAVIHTDRSGITRVISARKAKDKERTLFHAYLIAAIGPD